MPYAYADDMAMADLALRAWGQTVEETFIAAAEATMHAMVEDLATIAPREQRTFALHDAQLDLLLLQFLQELLFYKDAQRLMLRVYEVQDHRAGPGFHPSGPCGWGSARSRQACAGGRCQRGDVASLAGGPDPQRLGGHGGARCLNRTF